MSGSDTTPPNPDPHRQTLEVYEADARRWQLARRPRTADAAQLAEVHDHRHGPIIDLGCGPGWHLEPLGANAVGLDGAHSMLQLARRSAASHPLVCSDLRRLPFGRNSLGAAYADRSYVHLRRDRLPMALWDLHRALAVGAPAFLRLFEGDDEHRRLDDDDFPGRYFSSWPEPMLRAVVEGAGFEIELLERSAGDGVGRVGLWLRRARTLADTTAAHLRLLIVGLNPSPNAADTGIGFVTAGNRAWPALSRSGLASVDRDPRHLIEHHHIGMTDLVKRVTPRAAEIGSDEFAAGIDRLDLVCRWLQPAAVCVVGLSGWRSGVDPKAIAGIQSRTIGGRPVYLMPNPSGLNTHVSVDDLAEHFTRAARLADRQSGPRG